MLSVLVSKISKYLGIFAEKMWVAFANAEATHILSTKILVYIPYLMIKVLAIRQLTTLLVLNNLAQTAIAVVEY